MNPYLQKSIFIIALAACLTPFVNASIALGLGITIALTLKNPFVYHSKYYSKLLLKLSIVGLGFGTDINQVIEVGRSSFFITVFSITAILVVGQGMGYLIGVPKRTTTLISFGTAICGGSAIAAISPVIKANDDEIAVSMAAVFTLNALALFLFPPLGHLFELTQAQFGLWAALAIHDTSSVVGAATAYGAGAVAIATTVKLTRAIWIVPYCLAAGKITQSDEKTSIPLFIVGFVLAACLGTYLPEFDSLWHLSHEVAKQLLVVTLFLIGGCLSKEMLKDVGWKPLVFALILWAIVSSILLTLIILELI